MDIHSLTKLAGLIAISLSSVLFTSHSFADINADTNSEDRFWINRTHQNLGNVDNFQAVVEQTLSNTTSPIISDVIFETPNSFHQKVIQPNSFKGFEASYSNNTITLYDSLNKQALQIKGLAPYKKSSSLDRVRGIYMYNKEHYEQKFTPSIHVAERLSVGIDFMAKEDNLEIRKVEAFVDYHYSLIMQSNLIFNSGIESKATNISMLFNKDNLSLPSINLSKDTYVESWDFRKKHLSKKRISKKIDPNIIWPEDKGNTWGFSANKFYPQGNNTNAAAYYHSDNYFLITLTKKSSRDELSKLGVPVTLGNTHAVLNQLPTFANLQFKSKGIHYTLLSNIHPQSLLTMAKAIVSPKE